MAAQIMADYNVKLDLALGICAAPLALATGAATLRYRLYNLDRVISRTVVYASPRPSGWTSSCAGPPPAVAVALGGVGQRSGRPTARPRPDRVSKLVMAWAVCLRRWSFSIGISTPECLVAASLGQAPSQWPPYTV